VSTYAYLGPKGTFTEAALKKITSSNDRLMPYANVTAALDAVRLGKAHFALVPIENSVEGVVARTLDELATGEPLAIVGEVTLPVSFALMIKGDEKEILRIATHPHAEAQCRNYVATNYPDAELISTASTAAAAEAISRGEFDAAIAAPVAAAHYGLRVIADTLATILALSLGLLWLQSQDQFQRTQAGIAPHLLSLSALTTQVHCLIS